MDITITHDEDIVFPLRNPLKSCVDLLHPVFTMDRHEVFWFDQAGISFVLVAPVSEVWMLLVFHVNDLYTLQKS